MQITVQPAAVPAPELAAAIDAEPAVVPEPLALSEASVRDRLDNSASDNTDAVIQTVAEPDNQTSSLSQAMLSESQHIGDSPENENDKESGLPLIAELPADIHQNLSEELRRILRVIQHATVSKPQPQVPDSVIELQQVKFELLIDEKVYGLSNSRFVDALKQMDADLTESEEAINLRISLSEDALFGVTFSVTAGAIAWLLRGGAVVSSMLAALPMWAALDPLRLLNIAEKTNRMGSEDVERIFD